MYEQFDFEFRFQADANSFYIPLLRYLQKRSKSDRRKNRAEFSREQMILWALSAFWYPLACKWLGGFTDEELKQFALNAIYELQKQINYLQQVFGLDLQEVATTKRAETRASESQLPSTKSELTPVKLQSPSLASESLEPMIISGSNDSSPQSSFSPDSEIVMCSEDDDLLNKTFEK